MLHARAVARACNSLRGRADTLHVPHSVAQVVFRQAAKAEREQRERHRARDRCRSQTYVFKMVRIIEISLPASLSWYLSSDLASS